MSTSLRYPKESGYIHPDSGSNPWMIRIPLLTVTGLLLFFFIMVGVLAGYQYTYQDKIYPGVSTVFGLNMAGMTHDEARVALQEQFSYGSNATFVFHYGEQTWEFTAEDLGVSFDIDATINEAYNVGRGGNTLSNLWNQFDAWRNGAPVVPIITYNQTLAEQELGRVGRDYVNQPVIDATITIQNQRAQTTPSQVGRVVDVAATLDLVRQEIVKLSTRSEFNLVVREQAPEVWETETVAQQVNIALDPRGVTFYVDPEAGINLGPWTATPDSIENMLRIEKVANGDGTSHYEVNLTSDQVETFLNRVAPDLQRQPTNSRFVFNDESKQLEIIKHSTSGRALNVVSTLPRFEQAVFSTGERSVAMDFIEVQAPVNDSMTATELGITELVQSTTTYYLGSTAARRTNIQVAASRYHGLVIPPNTEFSFNEWLGDVSLDEGFEQGLIIYGNQTITGVGGGVCQVSTTAFQAAFYAGYPIVERYPHAYRVGYYETGEGPGMDSTVYSPIVDFRFLNDTPYHLLIETYVVPASSAVTFRFYSTDMGRTVTKDGPYIRNVRGAPAPIYNATPGLSPGQVIQVDYAVSGADVYVYRTVRNSDGSVLIDNEEFFSAYIPWPAQFQVAPGDARAR